MLMMSREAMESVITTKQKMADPAKKTECIADIEKMIGIKEAHLWRAEWGSCCGSIYNLVPQIETEIRMLGDILDAMKEGSDSKAVSLLENYLTFLEKNYKPEHSNY